MDSPAVELHLRSRALLRRAFVMPMLHRTDERIETCGQVVELATSAEDSLTQLFAWLALVHLHVQRGNRDAADVARAQLVALEAGGRLQIARPTASLWRALSAQIDGRFEDAHRWSVTSSQHAAALNYSPETWVSAFAVQQWWLRMAQGQTHAILEPWRIYSRLQPDMLPSRVMIGRLYAELGQHTSARDELERASPEALAEMPHDDQWLFWVAVAAEVCAEVEDTARAPGYLELLMPYADRIASVGAIAATVGAIARPLGRLCALLGRWDEVETLFATATRLHESLRSPPLQAWTQVDHAHALSLRGRPGDVARARRLARLASKTAQRLRMKAVVARANRLA